MNLNYLLIDPEDFYGSSSGITDDVYHMYDGARLAALHLVPRISYGAKRGTRGTRSSMGESWIIDVSSTSYHLSLHR